MGNQVQVVGYCVGKILYTIKGLADRENLPVTTEVKYQR